MQEFFLIRIIVFRLVRRGGGFSQFLFCWISLDDVSYFGGLMNSASMSSTRCSELVIVMCCHSRMNNVVLNLLSIWIRI